MSDDRGDYIQTHSGTKFYPQTPRVEEILLEDIAHALSNLCRYGGHSPRFYSVAQHSVLCAQQAMKQGLSQRVTRTVLLHDAAEAYLVDVPRPIKNMLPGYRDMEDRIAAVIAKKFDLWHPLPGIVHEIDNRMLCTEGAQFFAGQENQWWVTSSFAAPVYEGLVIEPMTPSQARDAFMGMALLHLGVPRARFERA